MYYFYFYLNEIKWTWKKCMYMTPWNADADDYDDAVDGLLQTTSCLGSECERIINGGK